jgi:hypothetical protein
MKKLKDLLSEVFDESPKVDKHQVIEGVKNYGVVGKSLYNGSNIMEIAKQLSEVAEAAHHHVLGEESDWFDKVSVSRNMKQLKGNVMEFHKTAKEAHALNQRLTGLYEDIGHVLNRYYDISEAVDHIDDKEAGTKYDDLKDKDIDNDGDTDDSDEYLHKKLGTVAKKDEAVGNPDNRDQVDKPDSPAKDGRDESLDPDNRDQVDQPSDPAKDGEEMKEVKRGLKDVGGVVGIPALGDLLRKK